MKKIFQPTVLRPMPGHDGSWLLMNTQEKGFASYSIPFASLEDVLDEYVVQIGPWGEDEHGRYLHVAPG